MIPITKSQEDEKKMEKKVQEMTGRIAQFAINSYNEGFIKMKIGEQNKHIISIISTEVAAQNIDLFYARFGNLNFDNKGSLLRSTEPLFDDFKRATFFYVVIAQYRLPIFQPGTIMFYSGVKQGCPLEVFHNNCGQNGPILGMSGALFLARFMGDFSFIYQEMGKSQTFSSKVFLPHIYQDALLLALNKHSEEDKDQHGRLIEIQQMILSIDDKVNELDDEHKKLFRQKDFEILGKQFSEKGKGVPTQFDVQEFRKSNMYFSNWNKLFRPTECEKIQNQFFDTITACIISKKGIFEDDNVYTFLEGRFKKVFEKNSENSVTESDKISKHNRSTKDPELSSNDPNLLDELLQCKTIEINRSEYFLDYDFQANGKLLEYHSKVFESLRTIFVNQNLSERTLFENDPSKYLIKFSILDSLSDKNIRGITHLSQFVPRYRHSQVSRII